MRDWAHSRRLGTPAYEAGYLFLSQPPASKLANLSRMDVRDHALGLVTQQVGGRVREQPPGGWLGPRTPSLIACDLLRDRSSDLESGSTRHRVADRCGRDDRRLPRRQIAESAAAVDVVPELGRGHAGERDVEDEPGRGEAGENGLERPLLEHRSHIEIAGCAERFGAEELIDPRRTLRAEEGLRQAGAKHRLGAVGDLLGQDLPGHLAEDPFLGHAVELEMDPPPGGPEDP